MEFPSKMDLSGIKHPGKIQAIQWSNCRGKLHRVAMIHDRVVLLDHNLERELAMLDLGGEACRCMKIYLGIQKHETKNVIEDFGPYIEKMKAKRKSRQYGLTAVELKLHAADRPPRHVQRIIELLIRYKCHYDLPEGTIITITSTGARPFVKGTWYYRWQLGGDKYMVLQVNVPKDWKTEVYDKGIAVVDDCLVLGIQNMLPFRYGKDKPRHDYSVYFIAQGRGELLPDNYRFGTKNATIIFAHEKWRFSFMDARVYYHDHQR